VKIREIVRYEIEYQFRSASTWIYAGLLFLVTLWISLATGADGDGGFHANAPELLAWGAVRGGMFGMLITAALFGDAAIRDVAVEMDPLLFTSPLKKAEYLGGRFLGALAVNAVVLMAIPLGLLAMTGLLAYFGPEVIGPFRVFAYVEPLLLFSLPNLVLVGAILFTIGMLARHMIPVYLGAIGILIGYVVVLNYASQIDSPLLAALVDPLGLVTLERDTLLWTAVERNARLVDVSAMLAWNRALWLAVAAATLALLHRSFRFAQADGGSWRLRRRRTLVSAPPSEHARHVDVPRVAGSFGFRTTVRQTLAVARNSLAEVAASRWFAGVLLACVGLTLLWGWNVGDTIFDTSTWPMTALVTEVVLSQRSRILFVVLVIVFAGELVWKDREVGVAEITDAAPLPDGAALLGRFLALVVIIVMFQMAAMAGGILIQALQGYYNFEIGLYLRVVFGLKLADYVLLGALSMTLHVLVNHKNLGHMAGLMAFGFTMAASTVFGISHNLLLYGRDPGWTYSDMNGFGPFAGPLVWFRLYWGGWALLLGVLGMLLWVRGREPGVRRRLRQAQARFTGPVVRTAGVAIALIVAVGGFIFYNTNVLNAYRTPDQAGAPQAAYETRYSQYEDLPQPTITHADLRVEIHPEESAVDLRGSYQLVNRTDEAIESVHVFVTPEIDTRSIALDREAAPATTDEEVGYRILALAKPLQPGESMRLTFDLGYRRRGFPNSGIATSVVGNGTQFNRWWLPFVGYQPLFELADNEARERFGLAPRAPLPAPSEVEGRRYRQTFRDADLVQVEMIIGTSVDQIAITPGVLRREWTENGRRYFHYATEQPESFGATVMSGRYAVVEDRWNDVALSVFHHPGHEYNLESHTGGMKAALQYLSAQFGPYPYGQLRIVEVPRYDSYGRAHPLTIEFTENFFFTRPQEGQFDQVFFGSAHEIAHTWWGGQVRSATDVRGGQGFVSESLANYSAMMVTEKTFGMEAARKVYDYQMERYLTRRAGLARDVPLLESEDQAYIFYGKGAVAMYTLREHLGEERLHTALRRFLEKHRAGVPPYPTSYDLYAELRAATPDSLHPLLTDLFETVTLWDVKTGRAHVEPAGTGEYRVAIDVVAKKVRADSVGNETEVPMDDLVEIGVFADGDGDGDGDGFGAPLYLQRHRIRSGKQTIRVTVPRPEGGAPARAGIDPYRKLIDRQRDDNVVAVE
jgi:ABC-2 type transport system permease protein